MDYKDYKVPCENYKGQLSLIRILVIVVMIKTGACALRSLCYKELQDIQQYYHELQETLRDYLES